MRRLLSLILVILATFILSRALIRALPGDPMDTLLGESGTSLSREVLKQELHLDEPFLPALIHDLGKLPRADFGVSLFSKQPIRQVLFSRWFKTLILTFSAMSIGITLSLLLGLSANGSYDSRLTRFSDRFCTVYGAVTAALPTPWLGPILIYLFAFKLALFPVSGSLMLPAFALAIGFSGFWARLIRQRVRETLLTGSASAARARGIPEWKVVFKYGLIPSSGALIAYLGTQLGVLLGGAFVTEVIFDWPGIGSYFVEAVLRRDYPVVEAAAFLTAASTLIANFLGDWARDRIDPRATENAAQ